MGITSADRLIENLIVGCLAFEASFPIRQSFHPVAADARAVSRIKSKSERLSKE
jgi:hypothetical protein